MTFRTGKLYQRLKEQIVVLRTIPESQRDNNISDNFVYCDNTYDKSEYMEIIGIADNVRIAILKGSLSFDSNGFPVTESEYIGTVIPPLNNVLVDDLIIRIDKDCQELYIAGITEQIGVQELELSNQNKISGGRH